MGWEEWEWKWDTPRFLLTMKLTERAHGLVGQDQFV